jgi:hypothetical protein
MLLIHGIVITGYLKVLILWELPDMDGIINNGYNNKWQLNRKIKWHN